MDWCAIGMVAFQKAVISFSNVKSVEVFVGSSVKEMQNLCEHLFHDTPVLIINNGTTHTRFQRDKYLIFIHVTRSFNQIKLQSYVNEVDHVASTVTVPPSCARQGITKPTLTYHVIKSTPNFRISGVILRFSSLNPLIFEYDCNFKKSVIKGDRSADHCLMLPSNSQLYFALEDTVKRMEAFEPKAASVKKEFEERIATKITKLIDEELNRIDSISSQL